MSTVARFRRFLGLCCLSTTVFLWTASNFLASSIFADATYSKPYFVTYLNTACFILPLLPFFSWKFYKKRRRNDSQSPHDVPIASTESESQAVPDHADEDERTRLLNNGASDHLRSKDALPPLTIRETFNLSVKFSILWFASNYFSSASLQFTSVASVTILSSTSSVFTLIFSAIFRVERFTVRKLLGVLAGLAGVALITKADSDAKNNKNRGSFPYKSPGEIALGDGMALFTAVLYGVYTVSLVRTVGNETRIKMPLFFGFIGIIVVLVLWPGLLILHWTGFEPFQPPPSGRVWAVVLINAVASLVGDMTWAYAMLLLSPLVVTVGLSLCIPLSLLGQIVLDSHWASPLYFVGAGVVLIAFVYINHQSYLDAQAEDSD